MKYFVVLILIAQLISCKDTQSAVNNTHELEIAGTYMIHNVYVWAKDGTTQSQLRDFERALDKLASCPTIQYYFWGPPAATEERAVVDNSYDYAINVFFASMVDHDAYQKEPIHLNFIEEHKDIWEKVIVYDNMIR